MACIRLPAVALYRNTARWENKSTMMKDAVSSAPHRGTLSSGTGRRSPLASFFKRSHYQWNHCFMCCKVLGRAESFARGWTLGMTADTILTIIIDKMD